MKHGRNADTHTHTKYIESLKTNIAPEKNWLEDEISFQNGTFLKGWFYILK